MHSVETDKFNKATNGFANGFSFQINEWQDIENNYVSPLLINHVFPEESLDNVFSSAIMNVGILLTLLLVQVTSDGLAPAIIFMIYVIVCLVGIYRHNSIHDFSKCIAVICVQNA